MLTYDMVVTDITNYGSALFCVAGWDLRTGAMVRPEPPGSNASHEASRFWSSDFVGPNKLFSLGNVARFSAALPPHTFAFPHATEDRVFNPHQQFSVIKNLQSAEVPAAAAASVSASLAAVYDGGLNLAPSGKAYVTNGYQGRSLGAIEVSHERIIYYENKYGSEKPKLRMMINDGIATYDLGVTAADVRQRWSMAGIAALEAQLKASPLVHVRLGLSRPFSAKPNECYAQVNGLYFL